MKKQIVIHVWWGFSLEQIHFGGCGFHEICMHSTALNTFGWDDSHYTANNVSIYIKQTQPKWPSPSLPQTRTQY